MAEGWTRYSVVNGWLDGGKTPVTVPGAWKVFPGGVRREVVGADEESLQTAIDATELDWSRQNAPVVESPEAAPVDVVTDHALSDDELHALASKVALDASQAGAVDPRDNGRLLAAMVERLTATSSEGTAAA